MPVASVNKNLMKKASKGQGWCLDGYPSKWIQMKPIRLRGAAAQRSCVISVRPAWRSTRRCAIRWRKRRERKHLQPIGTTRLRIDADPLLAHAGTKSAIGTGRQLAVGDGCIDQPDPLSTSDVLMRAQTHVDRYPDHHDGCQGAGHESLPGMCGQGFAEGAYARFQLVRRRLDGLRTAPHGPTSVFHRSTQAFADGVGRRQSELFDGASRPGEVGNALRCFMGLLDHVIATLLQCGGECGQLQRQRPNVVGLGSVLLWSQGSILFVIARVLAAPVPAAARPVSPVVAPAPAAG